MDKYQLRLLNNGTITFVSENGEEKIEFDNILTVYQNENYKIGRYKIIFSNPLIEKIVFNSKEYLNNDNRIAIDFNFEETCSSVSVSFKNGIANDCIIEISKVFADKEAYDLKVQEETKAKYTQDIALTTSTGMDLINVFWKKANSSVNKVVLKIFYESESGISYQIINKNVDGEFFSLTELGFGKYKISLEEYANDNLLISINNEVILSDVRLLFKEELKNTKNEREYGFNSIGNTVVHR